MDREQLDRWCERGILGLVLALLVYSPLAFGGTRMLEFLGIQWLAAALLGVWLVRFWVNPQHRLLWPPVCWAVLGFMGYAVARYLTSPIEYAARQEMIRVLIYGFVFFAVLNNLHRQETTQIIGLTLVFLAMGIAMYALYQYLSNTAYVWLVPQPAGYRKRGSGTFISPNHMAGYLEMVLPLALTYTLTGKFSYLMKVLLGYASLVIFSGIVVSVSRGGWIACGIGLGVLFCWLFRQRSYWLQALAVGGALAAIATVLVLKAQFSERRFEALRAAIQFEDVRFMLWPPATRMWRDHVWWGVGPGHFDHRFPQYRPITYNPSRDVFMQYRPERVHNDYLNTLTDWGVAGALLVGTAWALFFWGVARSWKHVQRAPTDFDAKRSNRTAMVVGGTTGLMAVLLHSWVDFNMHVPANALLAVTLMALVSGHFRFATEGYWQTVRWPLRWAVSMGLIAGLAYLGWQGVQRSVEQHWLRRAAKAEAGSTARKAALEKAFAVEPRNFQTAYDIGEGLRMQSWAGAEGYQAPALAAIEWFQRSAGLNPFNPHPWTRQGMCLDWIGRHTEARSAFQKAYALDPHGFYTLAHLGWHYAQVEDFATAEKWLDLAYRLYAIPNENLIPLSYLKIIRERMTPSPGAK